MAPLEFLHEIDSTRFSGWEELSRLAIEAERVFEDSDDEFFGWHPVHHAIALQALKNGLEYAATVGDEGDREEVLDPIAHRRQEIQDAVFNTHGHQEGSEGWDRWVSSWAPMLTRMHWLSTGHSGSESVALWRYSSLVSAKPTRTGDPIWRSAAAITIRALQSIAENHYGQNNWHIHPLKDGRHLGYRLLFDSKRTQDQLAWEAHGRGQQIWGHPASSLVPQHLAGDLYRSALRACMKAGQLRRQPFSSWSARFVSPGSNTYVAVTHNHGTFTVPGVPQKW